MTDGLCKGYPALDPIKIRKYQYHEVMLLVKRLADKQSRADSVGGSSTKTEQITNKNGDVIRKKEANPYEFF